MTPGPVISKYYHDRSKDCDDAVGEAYKFIETLAGQDSLEPWYAWFQKKFSLPPEVIQQSLKKYLSGCLDYRDRQGFESKILAKSMALGASRYLLFVGLLTLVGKEEEFDPLRARLIIDHQWSTSHLLKYEKLIELFGPENVVVLAPGEQAVSFPGVTVLRQPRMSNLCISPREKMEVCKGFLTHFTCSHRSGINLFNVAINILQSLFSSRATFRSVRSKFSITDQQFRLDPVRNYVFKSMGGLCSSVIQAHIHILGRLGLYYDADILFSLGKKTGDRVVKFGGRFKDVVPVGSLALEYALNNEDIEPREVEKFDLVCILNKTGLNSYQDLHSNHVKDYYDHWAWLAKLSRKCPELKIGVISPSSNKIDSKVIAIIEGTKIERIDNNVSSYLHATRARINVVFGSTMGFEMMGHGIPCVFLDPGFRNSQFLPSDINFGEWRVGNFESFQKIVNKILKGGKDENNKVQPADFCLESCDVSDRIYSYFTSAQFNEN